jgi:hypothetical protein
MVAQALRTERTLLQLKALNSKFEDNANLLTLKRILENLTVIPAFAQLLLRATVQRQRAQLVSCCQRCEHLKTGRSTRLNYGSADVRGGACSKAVKRCRVVAFLNSDAVAACRAALALIRVRLATNCSK